MKDLTARQREILQLAVKVEHATGKPCTFHQLARKLEISPVGVRHHVEALQRKGWLESARSPLLRRHPEG
jgi:predicted ArsR family transcriptional regulator